MSASALLLAFVLAAPAGAGVSQRDDAFLEDLSRRSFEFFWRHADPYTGLVLDRTRADGSGPDKEHETVASAATTGFGLSALCIAAERGWVPRKAATARATGTLRFLAEKAPREHGWFYHWMDSRTGARVWNSELSSIDTAILLAGILTVKGCFPAEAELVRHADAILDAVDYPWMLVGETNQLSMGWYPDKGFISSRWDTYSEGPLVYILGAASRTRPLGQVHWRSWKREWTTYGGERFLHAGAPLFTHQYPQAWVDLRGRRDADGTDYFANSAAATRVHRRVCLDLAKEFPGYTKDVWGITASDGPKGYVAWGGPPRHPDIDGSVVPAAAGGSLMFSPKETLPALKAMKKHFGPRIWGPYSFADAFHPNTAWTGADVLGIDLGITLLSAENLRTGNVWRWFMANREVPAALDRLGVVRQ